MAVTKEQKEKIIKDFAINDRDTGSVEVQIALQTKAITELTDHCQRHPKDASSKRGLIKLVSNRRKFLKYLENKNVEKYKQMIERLGLRK